jgi:hypothetical protein
VSKSKTSSKSFWVLLALELPLALYFGVGAWLILDFEVTARAATEHLPTMCGDISVLNPTQCDMLRRDEFLQRWWPATRDWPLLLDYLLVAACFGTIGPILRSLFFAPSRTARNLVRSSLVGMVISLTFLVVQGVAGGVISVGDWQHVIHTPQTIAALGLLAGLFPEQAFHALKAAAAKVFGTKAKGQQQEEGAKS